MTKIIAMWSGPRNLSTAMMRSFGSRADCTVMDEPFYAAALAASGMDHPIRDEIIEAGEVDPTKVARACLTVSGAQISYQKHMMHHMLPGFPLDWVHGVTNVFLIRDPARVLSSYANKWRNLTAFDVGYEAQRRLFDDLCVRGQKPVVVDATEIRADPAAMLSALCDAVNIPFDPAMLAWDAGPRPEDGIWAKHWYDAVWQSTGFAPPDKTPMPVLSGKLKDIEDEVRPHYAFMRRFCLSP